MSAISVSGHRRGRVINRTRSVSVLSLNVIDGHSSLRGIYGLHELYAEGGGEGLLPYASGRRRVWNP